jgi:hypothetical protein
LAALRQERCALHPQGIAREKNHPGAEVRILRPQQDQDVDLRPTERRHPEVTQEDVIGMHIVVFMPLNPLSAFRNW